VEQKQREEQKARILLRGSRGRERTEIKEGRSLKEVQEVSKCMGSLNNTGM